MSTYTEKFVKELDSFYEWVNAESEIELKPGSQIEIDEDDITWNDIRDTIEYTEPGRNKLDKYIQKVLEDFVISFDGDDYTDYKIISKMYKEYIEKKKQDKKPKKDTKPKEQKEKNTKPKEKEPNTKILPKQNITPINDKIDFKNDKIRISIAVDILKKCKMYDLKLIITSLENICENNGCDIDDEEPLQKIINKPGPSEIKKSSPEIKKSSPEIKKSSPEIKKSSPEIKKTSPSEIKKSSPEIKTPIVQAKTQEEELQDIFDELGISNEDDESGNETEEIEDDMFGDDDFDEDELLDNMD